MNDTLLIVGVVLLVVGFVIVPEVVDDIVPPIVERVVKSVERVAMAAMNRFRPADPAPGRIEQLEAEVVALNESIQRLTAAQKEVLERAASSTPAARTTEDHTPK